MMRHIGIAVLVVAGLCALGCAGKGAPAAPAEARVVDADASVPQEHVQLVETLGSADPSERARAELKLRSMGHQGVGAILVVLARWERQKESGMNDVQRTGLNLLGEFAMDRRHAVSDPAVSGLIVLSLSKNREVAGHAAAALKPLGVKVLPRLAAISFELDPRRSRAARATMMAVDDKGTIDLFIDMLVDPEKRLDATEKQVCDALKDITAEDRGYDAARDDKGREEAVQRWIAWWKQTRPVYKRPVRAQEFTPAPAEKPKTPTPPAPAEPEKPKAPAPQPQPAKPEAKPEPQPAPAKDDSATKAPAETKAPEKPAAK